MEIILTPPICKDFAYIHLQLKVINYALVQKNCYKRTLINTLL